MDPEGSNCEMAKIVHRHSKQYANGQWRPACAAFLLLSICILLTGCRGRDSAGDAITIILDPGANSFAVDQQLAREFERETGHAVRLLKAPASSTERLSQYLQYLGAESPDVDVYQVDVIWPATLENHLADLSESFTTETAAFLPALIANNTINGKLLAIPWYVDVPLLYYRDDLLRKYGFQEPPATWDELTTMAAAVQRGERMAGQAALWGFVWQGMAYEGLTCNALEWQVSEGGGRIVAEEGAIEVNTPGARRAFTRAAGWVGSISPPGVTTYAEEECRQMFQSGNAVFMRNWPYAYSLVNGNESPVAGKVRTASLPAGSAGRAAVLGGWQLAVSRYSKNPAAATELVRYMTSRHGQKQEALGASRLPTRLALYDDPDIASEFPFIPTMRHTLDNAVARPSKVVGVDYNEVSTYYYQAVHEILTGQNSADEALSNLDALLRKVLDQ